MFIHVIIPAYNEEKTVAEVVRKTLALQVTSYKLQAIVVDDGSIDRTAAVAREAGALVLRHPINRGLGAALATGIEGALWLSHNNHGGLATTIIVTLDADGQHDPADIPWVIEPILKGEAEMVIGSRFIFRRHLEAKPKDASLHDTGFFTSLRSVQNDKQKGMPWYRRLANFCGNFFTWLLFGIWVSDSQSGFRAFSASAANQLRLRTSSMEVSSEIIREIARLHLRVAEVPISIRYTPYSLSKGQGFIKGLETLWKLIMLKFFR